MPLCAAWRRESTTQTLAALQSERMLLYYITDRRQFEGTETQKLEKMLAKVREAAKCGIDLVQIREKDLPARQLLELVRAAAQQIRDVFEAAGSCKTRLLVNSRTDIALAAAIHGVHLTGIDIRASDVRAVWGDWVRRRTSAGRRMDPGASDPRLKFTIAVSCHNAEEVRTAEAHGADLAVLAPVFEKRVREVDEHGCSRVLMSRQRATGEGLAELREACRGEDRPAGPEAIGSTRMPVLALGGVTVQNARLCLEAGAAGVAGIRLFQDNDVAEVMRKLRLAEAGVSANPCTPD